MTGASKGIGRAVALRLAAAGGRVTATGRDARALAELADLARERGLDLRVQAADLTVSWQRVELVAAARAFAGPVSVLVHSAGTYRSAPLELARLDDLDDQYDINVRAPYALTQLLLDDLRRTQGDVVFVNSTQGLVASPRTGQYAATKHALRAVADSLRGEVGVGAPRVCTLAPGRTATPMQQEIFRAEGRAWTPELLMRPEDVADIVLAAVTLPPTVEVTDILMRPARPLPAAAANPAAPATQPAPATQAAG